MLAAEQHAAWSGIVVDGRHGRWDGSYRRSMLSPTTPCRMMTQIIMGIRRWAGSRGGVSRGGGREPQNHDGVSGLPPLGVTGAGARVAVVGVVEADVGCVEGVVGGGGDVCTVPGRTAAARVGGAWRPNAAAQLATVGCRSAAARRLAVVQRVAPTRRPAAMHLPAATHRPATAQRPTARLLSVTTDGSLEAPLSTPELPTAGGGENPGGTRGNRGGGDGRHEYRQNGRRLWRIG